jgi:hypothetical protein
MARYTTSIRCSLSAGDAFARVADLANLADWDPGVTTSTQVVGDGPGPDAEYDVTLSTGSMTLRYVTTAFTGPRSVTYEAKASWFTSIDVISVEPTDSGSIVTYDATLRLPILLRLGDSILGLVFRRVGDAAAGGLRAALEGEFAS